jgi:hypothetical protein
MEQMNLVARVEYFEQVWEKFLPDIPAPRPTDIDWDECPVKIVEKAIFSTARRYYDAGLEFRGKRHAYNYVAKICRSEWAKAIVKAREADQIINAACVGEDSQEFEENAI